MRYAREIWLQIVEQFESSGLTQEEYASQRGIPVSTLRSWIYKVRRERSEEAPLLPVRVISSAALLARQPADEGGGIEVQVGDAVRVRFPSTTTPAAIAELVGLLRAQC